MSLEPGTETASDEQTLEEEEAAEAGAPAEDTAYRSATPFPRTARTVERARARLEGGGAEPAGLDDEPVGERTRPTIDVVVVTHNSQRDLERCAPSLEREIEAIGARLVFVDNGSSDRSAKWLLARERLQSEVVELGENRGYAAAVNAAAARSRAQYLVVLNPDIEILEPDAILRLVEHLECHPEAAVAAPRLLGPDGSTQSSVRATPTLPMLLARQTRLGRTGVGRRLEREYLQAPRAEDGHSRVEWALGAALAIRRSDFDRVGGWDDGYFLYFEDVDFCFRLRAAGREVHHLPGVAMVHGHRRDSRRENGGAIGSQVRRHHLRSALRFFRKYPHRALRRRPEARLTSPLGEAARRGIDIAISATALTLLAPLMLAVALCIRLDSPGPVLFRQKRLGRERRPFTMLKFRTMTTGAESTVADEAVRRHVIGDPITADENGRPVFKCMPQNGVVVTRVGGFLRRWSIDELPQLINVLRGEMTLVGYRPPIATEIEHYPDWYFGRFVVKPGLTGIWQVSGRNGRSYMDMVRWDIEYAKSRSWRLDLSLLARTVPAILLRRGAY